MDETKGPRHHLLRADQLMDETFDKGLERELRGARNAIRALILAVEELSSKATPRSETSFVPIPGLASKQSLSPSANQALMLELTTKAITDYFKSTPYTVPECLDWTWEDWQTLQLTLRWPIASGENRDGDPGVAQESATD